MLAMSPDMAALCALIGTTLARRSSASGPFPDSKASSDSGACPRRACARLAADEARFALFLERRQAFLHVVAVGMHLAREEFEPQGGFDRLLEAVVDQRLHAAQDERALVAQAGNDLAGGGEQFGVIDDPVDQARRDQFFGGHEVAGEEKVLRARRADL